MPTAFLGLGALGRAIAGRLIATGTDLVVWNRTAARADGLDAPRAATPAAAAAAADVVLLCLADSAAVRSVLHDQGLLAACRGKLIVDTTTNHYRDVLDFHRDAAAAGAAYLECPVAGSVMPASNGALTLLAGGRAEDLRRARPLLDRMGATLFHWEEPGLATRMKLVNNLALGGIMAVLAEALKVGEAAGLDRARVLDVLAAGGGESLVLRAKKQKLLERDWAPHFKVGTILKDLNYLLELAGESGAEAPVAEQVKGRFAGAVANGRGDLDFAAVADDRPPGV